jgi:IS5 family transposase
VPRAQVADSDCDDLGRPVWTQRRVQRRELAHHLVSTEARIHQATHIQALVQSLQATVAVPEASRTDICQERTLTRYWSGGVRNRGCTQGDGRRDGQANYPNLRAPPLARLDATALPRTGRDIATASLRLFYRACLLG